MTHLSTKMDGIVAIPWRVYTVSLLKGIERRGTFFLSYVGFFDPLIPLGSFAAKWNGIGSEILLNVETGCDRFEQSVSVSVSADGGVVGIGAVGTCVQ